MIINYSNGNTITLVVNFFSDDPAIRLVCYLSFENGVDCIEKTWFPSTNLTDQKHFDLFNTSFLQGDVFFNLVF